MARVQAMGGAIAVAIVALATMGTAAMGQPASGGAPPNAANQPPPDLDLQCRRQAADQTGYRAGNGSEQAYASAYYACMDDAANPPPPPPPDYYSGPYPYPYAYPYAYPYPYYGPYYGPPAIGFRFGFGGWHGRR